MSDLYERIAAATGTHFASEAERERHILRIVETVLRAKGLA